MHLSVIIPAYNEEKRIPKTLAEIDKYLRNQKYDYEIIVISDGSKDKTGEVVKGLLPKIKNLRLIDNKKNHGKGYVVRQGLLEAKGDYRLFTDADNSTSVDQVEKMWPYLKGACPESAEGACPEPAEGGYDIVIGSRDAKGAVLDPPQPFKRKVLGDIFRLLTQIICGTWGILDSQCGFKGFTKKSAEAILPKCKIDRFAFDPEILILAGKSGYKIKEIPINWKNDPESKVKFSSMLKMFKDLFRIRLNLIKRVYG